MADSIRVRGASWLRNYETEGVPLSGNNEPDKAEGRDLFRIIDAALASLGTNGAITVKYAARATLFGDLAHAANTLAIVYNDGEDSGIYTKVGTSGSGSWSLTDIALPATFSVDVASALTLATTADEKAGLTVGALDGHAFRDEATPRMHNGYPILSAIYDDDGNRASFVTQEGEFFPSPDRTTWLLVGRPQTPAYRQGLTLGYGRTARNSTCYIAMITGQSLAYGYGLSGVGVVSSTPVYPGLALMPSIGVRMPTVMPYGDNTAPNGRQFSSLVDLVEVADPAIYACESSASGLVNTLIALHQEQFQAQPRVAALVAARGGSTYAELKRGTVTWAWMLRGLADMVDAIRAKGWTPKMLPIVWRQTEAEQVQAGGITAAAYEARLLQLVRDMNEDVAAIFGEPVEVQMILEAPQVPSGPVTHPIIEAQTNAAARDARLILGPTYVQHPRAAAYPSLQEIHLSAAGYFRAGVNDARVIFDHVFGTGYIPPLPEEDYVEVGRQDITLRFPVPVQFDETNTDVKTAGLPNYKGFFFDDYSGSPPTITSHIVHNGNPGAPVTSGLYVTLHLSAVPTGSRWRIGYGTMANPQSGTPGTGPITGMRGLLRLSRAPIGPIDSYNNYEWVRPFIRTLEA